jgi:hypothetical protein
MGHTLTFDIPEDVYQSLVQKAEQTGQLPETVAVELLATATQQQLDDPLERVSKDVLASILRTMRLNHCHGNHRFTVAVK